MSVTFITDHIAQAKARLIEQYKGKQRIEGMVSASVEEIQNLEDVFKALNMERGVETAEGTQLDKIGEIVGIERVLGQSDAEYRLEIKAKIVQNLNQGTPEEIIAAAKFFIGATFAWYLEVYPAAVDIFTTTPLDPALAANIRLKLESFLPAGVKLDSLGYYDPDAAFRFDMAPGFGDTDDSSVGGLLAEVY